jgi:quinol monooxygenase YgiN
MPYAFIRQNIGDYTKWKAGFDGDSKARQAAGCIGSQIFRDADGSNTVSVLMKFKDMESLQALKDRMQTPELQELMAEAGVIGAPEALYVFDGVEETPA